MRMLWATMIITKLCSGKRHVVSIEEEDGVFCADCAVMGLCLYGAQLMKFIKPDTVVAVR